ncbi:MAG: RDD family protein [Planctomycetes bacterium]|nr:RDD family protein [Planctomycetota bacterium]
MKSNSPQLPLISKFASMLFALALALAVVPACKASHAAAPSQTEQAGDDAVDSSAEIAAPETPEAPAELAAMDDQADDGSAPATTVKSTRRSRGTIVHRSHTGNEIVSFGKDSIQPAEVKADGVVSIFGSSTANGEVGDAVVSVMGSSTSSGNVGDAVVSILGNTRVNSGTVGGAAVAVMGSTYVNGHIKGDVVAIMGNLELGPDAVVDGEAVCVGGEIKRDPKAVIKGEINHVAIGGPFNFEGIQVWVKECLLYARPLAFNAELMWAWYIALGVLGFYAFLALVAPSGVNRCVQTLEQRPGMSILASLLIMVLTPVVTLLLLLTLTLGIGFVLLPLFTLAMCCAEIFGKVVLLAWIGRRITKLFDEGAGHPAIAVILGGAIVLLLYTVPILGFVLFKVLGVFGTGIVLYTLLLMYKNHRRSLADEVTATAPAAPAFVPPLVSPVAGGAVGAAPQALHFSASTMERAGFWIRLIASILDIFMVSIVFAIVSYVFHWDMDGGGILLLFVIYNMVMWATKGTTIGGVICGLRVVRLDDRPVDGGIAVVRGLSSFLSLAVAGLGFIWVAFDDQRQSWHDKIAGTTVVKVPKGTPLL